MELKPFAARGGDLKAASAPEAESAGIQGRGLTLACALYNLRIVGVQGTNKLGGFSAIGKADNESPNIAFHGYVPRGADRTPGPRNGGTVRPKSSG